MTAWWSGSAILWDCETDSKEPTDARIITSCIAYVHAGHETEIDTWLVKPERDIPEEASAIHGVSTEHAAAHGMDRDLAIAEIAQGLHLIHRGATRDEWGSAPVIGHNIRYDLTVLDREMRRTGAGSLGIDGARVTVRVDGRQVGAFHVIDTMVLDRWVDPFRPRLIDDDGSKMKGNRRLGRVAEVYGVPIRGDAHTAEADALAAGRVAWAIARRCDMAAGETTPGTYDMDLQRALFELYADRRHPSQVCIAFGELGRMILPELHRAQIMWAAEQAAGLREYFGKNPDRGDWRTVSEAWPLEPVGTVDAVTDLV